MQDILVRLDESAQSPSVALAPAFAGLADVVVAGADVTGEFRCSDCGYGAVVRRALPPCPMCSGTVRESRAPRSPD